jgi:hypothetical protein
MTRHFCAEDFSVGAVNHEEDVKRLEHDYLDTEKIASPETRPRMTALQHQQSRTWTVLRNP